jgi:hypothetical protein
MRFPLFIPNVESSNEPLDVFIAPGIETAGRCSESFTELALSIPKQMLNARQFTKMDKNVAFVKIMPFLDQMLGIFINSDYRALLIISGAVIMIRSILYALLLLSKGHNLRSSIWVN